MRVTKTLTALAVLWLGGQFAEDARAGVTNGVFRWWGWGYSDGYHVGHTAEGWSAEREKKPASTYYENRTPAPPRNPANDRSVVAPQPAAAPAPSLAPPERAAAPGATAPTSVYPDITGQRPRFGWER